MLNGVFTQLWHGEYIIHGQEKLTLLLFLTARSELSFHRAQILQSVIFGDYVPLASMHGFLLTNP